MRRKRRKLEVSTFPFLAVLLCAMGSLLLVLLIIDQRAKLAAREKAQQKADQRGRQRDEKARQAAATQAEWKQKNRQTRADWQAKGDALHARLGGEKKLLEGELGAVQARLAEAAARLRAEQEKVQGVRCEADVERGKVATQERAVAVAREGAASAAGRLSAAEKERARMTADLGKLEGALKAVRAAKLREAETYSVVPYRGRQGENRRPLYVECSGSGVLFHPDGTRVAPSAALELRAEIERRLAYQKQEREGPRPYVLALVRPDGLESYYLLLGELRQAGADFGYELIDADWKLDFSTLAVASPRLLAPPSRAVVPGGGPVAGPAGGGPFPEGPGGTTGAPAAVGVAPGGPGGPAMGTGRGTGPGALPGGPSLGAPVPGGGPLLGGGPGPSPGGGQGTGLSGPGGTAPSGAASRLPGWAPGAGPPTSGAPGQAGSGPQRTASLPNEEKKGPASTGAGREGSAASPPSTGQAPQGGRPLASGSPPPPRGTARPTGTEPGGGTAPPNGSERPPRTSAGGGGSGDGGGGAPSAVDRLAPPGPPLPQKRPPTALRPARMGGPREVLIFLECRRDGIVLHPKGEWFPQDSLGHSAEHNRLHKAVRALVNNARARNAGASPHAVIEVRFLVRSEGQWALHRAKDALEPLGVPMRQQALHPEDDASAIAAGR